MKNALVLFAILGTAFAAVPEWSSRITGGENTTIEQYNFMTSMETLWGGILWSHWCGGTLLTRQAVLSVAHCYNMDPPEMWRAHLGSTDLTGGQMINVATIIMHPEHDYNAYLNDIAILRLASPATLGPNIGTALIAGPNYILADNTPVTAIGWGALWNQGPWPDTLQRVEVDIISWDVCAERYSYLSSTGYPYPEFNKAMFCSGILDQGGKAPCQGDYGGPLLHSGNVVYGIPSWGYFCGNGTYPGVNVAVNQYTDWIVDNGWS